MLLLVLYKKSCAVKNTQAGKYRANMTRSWTGSRTAPNKKICLSLNEFRKKIYIESVKKAEAVRIVKETSQSSNLSQGHFDRVPFVVTDFIEIGQSVSGGGDIDFATINKNHTSVRPNNLNGSEILQENSMLFNDTVGLLAEKNN